MPAWQHLPKACGKNVKHSFDNSFARWCRYYCWHYLWSGRRYGLHFHDQCFEPAPEVREALRRLNLKEPWAYDARMKRLGRFQSLLMQQEKLPRSEWTQWDQETFYLKPYLVEIEAEKLERRATSATTPTFQVRQTNAPTGATGHIAAGSGGGGH